LNVTKNLKQIAKAERINETKVVENLTNFIDNDFEVFNGKTVDNKVRIILTGIGRCIFEAEKVAVSVKDLKLKFHSVCVIIFEA
jgi:D-arabinose 5-phosphate isomerase GutQ